MADLHRDWVAAGLLKKGKSKGGLADALGVHQSQVTRIIKGTRKIQAAELALIAGYLDEPIPAGSPSEPAFRPPPEFMGERDLKVFSAAEGGPGEMVVSTDPIDVVPRPWYLKHVKEGFAVLITGESMVPVFDPGDYAIVNPRLPLVRGKDVILVADESEGEFRASIKRLIRWTEREWYLRQFNPPVGQKPEFTLSKKAWPKALRVIGKYDGS